MSLELNGTTETQNHRHTSESAEWFTPSTIIEAARMTMGGIDLDPTSCGTANLTVRATKFFGTVNNGYKLPWHGRVFLNPPGGRMDADGFRVVRDPKLGPCTSTGACGLRAGHSHADPVQSSARAWWFKLAEEWIRGRVSSGVFLGFSVEILQTTQVDPPAGLPLPVEFPLCFPARRIPFLSMRDGKLEPVKGNTHASVIVGIPPRVSSGSAAGEFVHRFRKAFAPIGRTK